MDIISEQLGITLFSAILLVDISLLALVIKVRSSKIQNHNSNIKTIKSNIFTVDRGLLQYPKLNKMFQDYVKSRDDKIIQELGNSAIANLFRELGKNLGMLDIYTLKSRVITIIVIISLVLNLLLIYGSNYVYNYSTNIFFIICTADLLINIVIILRIAVFILYKIGEDKSNKQIQSFRLSK